MSAMLRDVALLPAPRRGRWLLLCVAGTAVFAALLWLQWSLDARLQAAQDVRVKRMRQDMRQQAAPQAAKAAMTQAAVDALRVELRLLNRDWSALLSSLVPGDGIRLLTLDVNPVSGAVRIGAQADTREVVTAFVAALERTEPLAQVRLLRVEKQASGFVFEVDAQWL